MAPATMPSISITPRLLRAVFAAAVGGSFQFGFCTGFVNNTEVFIRRYFANTGLGAARGRSFDVMWSIAVSAFAVGGLLGTMVFPALANRIGRKWAVVATTGFCYISSYMTAFPAGWWALILARVLSGVGAGGACAAVPTYVSEIAPLAVRGMLGTVHQLMITIGILVAQGLSAKRLHLLGDDELWQYILLVPCGCATVLLVVLPGCEDSPMHLLRTAGGARAAEAVRWFRGPKAADEEVEQEVTAMHLEMNMNGAEQSVGPREALSDWSILAPILVGTGVNLSMQLSGIDAVLYYSTRVLEDAGVDFEQAQVYTVLIAALNAFVTLPAMLLMDSAGRKTIQLVGLTGMCGSYLVMTAALVLGCHGLAVLAMLLVVCFFAFGPGCIAWFIVAELTPVSARGFATAVGLGANWMANCFVAFIFPHILDRLHSWSFGLFAISTSFLVAFTVICLPETKGKTVAEISAHFGPGPFFFLVPAKREDSELSDLSTSASSGAEAGTQVRMDSDSTLTTEARQNSASELATPLLA